MLKSNAAWNVPIKLERAPAQTKSRKRFLAVGCSHGQMMDRSAAKALLKFRDEFKPHKVIHLGDWCDTAAWRSGAKASADEVADVALDIESGLTFLEQLEPTLVFNGNHEHRIWEAAGKPNAIVRQAAITTIQGIEQFIQGQLKAEYVQDYVLDKSWRRLGNYLVGHGFFYNTHATLKHAEKMGNCIFAHLHRQEVVRGSRGDSPTGVCVGYLGQRDKFKYADRWDSRLRWNAGWCYGEYSDDDCHWQLQRFQQPETNPEYKSV